MEYAGKIFLWILVIHVAKKLFLICACTVGRIFFAYLTVMFSQVPLIFTHESINDFFRF